MGKFIGKFRLQKLNEFQCYIFAFDCKACLIVLNRFRHIQKIKRVKEKNFLFLYLKKNTNKQGCVLLGLGVGAESIIMEQVHHSIVKSPLIL